MECAFVVLVTWSCCQETFWPQLIGQFEPPRSTIGKSGWLLYLKFICPHFACYRRVFLNVCFSYTSRREIAESVKTLVQGAAEGMIYPRSGTCSLDIYLYHPLLPPPPPPASSSAHLLAFTLLFFLTLPHPSHPPSPLHLPPLPSLPPFSHVVMYQRN